MGSSAEITFSLAASFLFPAKKEFSSKCSGKDLEGNDESLISALVGSMAAVRGGMNRGGSH